MQALHGIILAVKPACKLWFLDGKDSEGKLFLIRISDTDSHTMKYADGTTREFYQIGLSANKTGISVYILGIEDKKYLADTYGKDTRQGERDRVLHQIQNSKRYKHRCARSGNTIWV